MRVGVMAKALKAQSPVQVTVISAKPAMSHVPVPSCNKEPENFSRNNHETVTHVHAESVKSQLPDAGSSARMAKGKKAKKNLF